MTTKTYDLFVVGDTCIYRSDEKCKNKNHTDRNHEFGFHGFSLLFGKKK
jgi:hypothetical protein